MEIRNVGVVSPGDMGQAIAQRLQETGLGVHTALQGRSERTKGLAREIGLHDCGSLAALVETCDLVISLVNPGQSMALSGEVAGILRTTGRSLVFADLNAISPETARGEDRLVRDAGGIFIDGGVLGVPPRGEQRVRIFVSGPDAGLFEQIRHPSLQVRVLSDRVGDASAIKMCNAAMTKGLTALTLELLVAARRLGVEDALLAELRVSRADLLDGQMRTLPGMPSKAGRWVPEMEEIARTFEEVGLTRRVFEGAGDLYAMVAETQLGKESPEEARAAGRQGIDVIHALADTGGPAWKAT
jgi:3-hydroxyisobutyrate dehydrogenase-like beta-hydroxyacid dehydrogenase